jgi:hypothetical protein
MVEHLLWDQTSVSLKKKMCKLTLDVVITCLWSQHSEGWDKWISSSKPIWLNCGCWSMSRVNATKKMTRAGLGGVTQVVEPTKCEPLVQTPVLKKNQTGAVSILDVIHWGYFRVLGKEKPPRQPVTLNTKFVEEICRRQLSPGGLKPHGESFIKL